MAGGESIVPPMIHQCANESVIANSKSDIFLFNNKYLIIKML